MIQSKFYSRVGFLAVLLAAILGLAGCSSGGQTNGAAAAIENYLRSLAGKDLNQLINASCAAWEESARQELRTFDAVEVTLEDLSCQPGTTEDPFTLVSCSGKIVANYGNEVLEIDLSERQYLAVDEGGEWRMCGYK